MDAQLSVSDSVPRSHWLFTALPLSSGAEVRSRGDFPFMRRGASPLDDDRFAYVQRCTTTTRHSVPSIPVRPFRLLQGFRFEVVTKFFVVRLAGVCKSAFELAESENTTE